MPLDYLTHIRDECRYLLNAREGLGYEEFVRDETLKRSFVRSLEIIGEASRNVPEEFRRKHPGIEWREMAGMRDVLIHGYFGVDYKIVWDIVSNHIPALLEKVNQILDVESL
ncbi:MAG: DUF86 domain-containing protein [Candidatus Thermoplasmatota archaeon]